MLSAKLEVNGAFVREMVARRDSFRRLNFVAIRAAVPGELRWWYWLEWGTAERGITPHASGSPYEISPIFANKLRWYDYQGIYRADGKPGWVERDLVIHPGIYPRRFVFHSMPDIMADAKAAIKAYFRRGGRMRADELRRFMLREFPKSIRFWLNANLLASPEPVPNGWQGTTFNQKYRRSQDPQWARLGGRLATDVFDQALNFKDTSR